MSISISIIISPSCLLCPPLFSLSLFQVTASLCVWTSTEVLLSSTKTAYSRAWRSGTSADQVQNMSRLLFPGLIHTHSYSSSSTYTCRVLMVSHFPVFAICRLLTHSRVCCRSVESPHTPNWVHSSSHSLLLCSIMLIPLLLFTASLSISISSFSLPSPPPPLSPPFSVHAACSLCATGSSVTLMGYKALADAPAAAPSPVIAPRPAIMPAQNCE